MVGRLPDQAPLNTGLSLEIIADSNIYAERAIELYDQALATHEHGGDLTEFLRTIQWTTREGGMEDVRELTEEEIDFVLEGAKTDGESPDYDSRLGLIFSGDSIKSQRIQDSLLSGKHSQLTLAELYEEVPAARPTGALSFYDDPTLPRLAMWAKEQIGFSLSETFDRQCSNPSQVQALNHIMVDLAVNLDEPEAARYFLSQITDNRHKIEIFFNTVSVATTAAMAVQEVLKDLKDELLKTGDVPTYCDYLVREIAEVGSKNNVTVKENYESVMTLTADPKVNWESLASRLSRGKDINSCSPAETMRYRLVDALLQDDQVDLADRFVSQWVAKKIAELNKAKDFQPFKTRQMRESINSEIAEVDPRPKHRMGSSVLRLVPGGAARQKRARALSFLDSRHYRKDQSRVKPISSLPPGAHLSQYYGLRDLDSILSNGDNSKVYRKITTILSNPRRPFTTKIQASVEAATAFERVPELVMDEEARIAATIEMLALDIQEELILPPLDMVDESRRRQALSRRVTRLQARIEQLPDTDRRRTYKQELVKTLDPALRARAL